MVELWCVCMTRIFEDVVRRCKGHQQAACELPFYLGDGCGLRSPPNTRPHHCLNNGRAEPSLVQQESLEHCGVKWV